MELFTEDSPFFKLDLRRLRPLNPTTLRLLNHKHQTLLPESVVRGASVLDFGSCLGATGHWATQLGATRYVGVEHQADYVTTSRELLAGAPQAEIVQATADAYFAQSDERFDIVCLMGVAHGVFDAMSLIRAAARRAKTYFCFDDLGWDSERALVATRPMTQMPIAGRAAATFGFGWHFTPLAIEQVMNFLGFRPDGVPVFTSTSRWVSRYVRVGEEGMEASFSNVIQEWDAGSGPLQ